VPAAISMTAPELIDVPAAAMTDTSDWNVEVELTYNFNLITPIIGPLMAYLNPPEANLIPTEVGDVPMPDFPQLVLTETIRMSKPYRCVMESEMAP